MKYNDLFYESLSLTPAPLVVEMLSGGESFLSMDIFSIVRIYCGLEFDTHKN